ncbi:hypothetical protein [Halobacteriovorax sp. RT-2-4]|uniref:hypothetical protein n=1 Tax=unclassified Halobacteriovorax TaxID=2639665 RepID=UPI00399BD220
MKTVCKNLISIFCITLTANTTLASQINYNTFTKLFCSDDVSGHTYSVSLLDYKPNTTYILENSGNRSYNGHSAVRSIEDGEMVIYSEESDFGIAYPINDLSGAYYFDGGDSRAIECNFFDERNVKRMKLPKKLNFLKRHGNVDAYITDLKVGGLEIIQEVFENKVVDMGDWYPVKVDKDQQKKVLYTLDKHIPAFRKLVDDINNSGIQFVGLLFGRDWYYANGEIAFILRHENKLFLAHFEFDSDIRFGDKDLDYIY